MGKPAARIGDVHNCPAVAPGGVPHGGGPIVGPGSLTVLIEGVPAATVGDTCMCAGGLDKIVFGSTGVFIEGKEAVRQGDRCMHGGVVVEGSGTVLIGEGKGRMLFSKPDTAENNEEFVEPPPEEKNRIITQAIQECIVLLEKKLELLEKRDGKTMEDFKTWFGKEDEGAIDLIMNRIRRILEMARNLTLDNFSVIVDEYDRIKTFACVWPDDEFHTIYLGQKFWNDKHTKSRSQDLVLVHELSHFDDVGGTEDVDYGIDMSLHFSKREPINALINAENFELFIKA